MVMLTAIAKAFGFFKEIYLAYKVGPSLDLDKFLFFLVFFYFPQSIVTCGVQASLIPIWVNLRQNQIDSKGLIFSILKVILKWVSTGNLLFFTIVFVLVCFDLFEFPLDMDKEGWVWTISFMIPVSYLNSINQVFYGILQADKKFAKYTLIPLFQVFSVGFHLFFYDTVSFLSLIQALVIGTALETVTLTFFNRQHLSMIVGDTIPNTVYSLRKESKELMPVFLFQLSIPLVDSTVAASLGVGYVSILGFGNRIPSTMQALLVATAAIVVLPYFSSQDFKTKFLERKDNLNQLCMIYTLPMLFFIFPLILYSTQICELVFQRGSFSSSFTIEVSGVQSYYFMLVPLQMLYMLMSRVLIALQKSKELRKVTLISAPVNVILSYLFASWLGVKGIAMASIVASLVAVTILFRISLTLRRGISEESVSI
jgi:peptidoglycan biosynthesis protein MviN/MurJ (putative lipid II flippase)